MSQVNLSGTVQDFPHKEEICFPEQTSKTKWLSPSNSSFESVIIRKSLRLASMTAFVMLAWLRGLKLTW